MSYATEWLMSFRYIIKGQDALIKEICDSFKLTRIEGTIIVFLYNNPGKNTAGDIVELRMLSKGNVSQAVESLIQKSFLARKQDAEDRREDTFIFASSSRTNYSGCRKETEGIRLRNFSRVYRGRSMPVS